jgi:peptide/nickel transport system substrate-binding protein
VKFLAGIRQTVVAGLQAARSLALALALALSLSLSLALALALAGQASAGHADGEGGRLNVRIFDDFGGFDHILAPHAGLSRLQILFAVHDRLFELGARAGKQVPKLALRAAARNDFKTWRVTLRSGVQFSNGEKLDAGAYVQHFERLLKSEYARRFRAVMGAPLTKVVAAGKLIIDFQFTRPNPGFRAVLGHGGAFVWSLSAPEFMARNRAHPGLSGMSAGAGPYRIAAWEPGKRVVLRRNPNYWDPANQHLDEIIYHVLDGAGPGDVLGRLRSGQLDAAVITSDAAIRAARKPRRFSVYRKARDQFIAAVGFNRNIAPLDDRVVRLALAQAIDRRAIARALGGGDGDVANQLFQGAAWRCGSIGYPAYDPDGARNILEALDVDFTRLALWTDDIAPLRRAARHMVCTISAAHCRFEAVKTEVLPYLPIKRGVFGLVTRNDIGGVALTGDPVIGYHRMFRK